MLCNLCAYMCIIVELFWKVLPGKYFCELLKSLIIYWITLHCLHTLSQIGQDQLHCSHDDRKVSEWEREERIALQSMNLWLHSGGQGQQQQQITYSLSWSILFSKIPSTSFPTTLQYFSAQSTVVCSLKLTFFTLASKHVTKLPTTLVWQNMNTEQFKRHLPSKNTLARQLKDVG